MILKVLSQKVLRVLSFGLYAKKRGQPIVINETGKNEIDSIICPYGMKVNLPEGENFAFLNVDRGNYIIGKNQEQISDLSEGEISFYSGGGATIALKNNGDIIFNNKLKITSDGQVVEV